MKKINQKRGQIETVNLFSLIVYSFAFILIVGTFLYVFGIIDNSLSSGNIIVGSVNASNSSDYTFGAVNDAFISNADLIGYFFIFGIVIAMLVNAYFTRSESIKLMIIFDIIILIFAYIISIYMSNSYEYLLQSLPYADTIISNLSNSSSIMLNLPTIVLIVGILVMIISYSGLPKSAEEEVPGF